MRYFLAVVFGMLIVLTAGCVFNDDSGTNADWKDTSLPSQLLGDWYYEGVLDMTVNSKKVILFNRPWVILANEKHKSEDIRRMILSSDRQYMAIYFRNIGELSMERSKSLVAYTQYQVTNDAELSYNDGWISVYRKVTE